MQVDFADKFVGGLSMWADHVAQEELIFALRPELHAVMLVLNALKDDEALVVKGAESFVLYSGKPRVRLRCTPCISRDAMESACIHLC